MHDVDDLFGFMIVKDDADKSKLWILLPIFVHYCILQI